MIGVDEAGKGPVLGSMFVAAVEYESSIDVEVADSKQLTPKRRSEVAAELQERCPTAVVEVTPSKIDRYVDGDTSSMNDLMAEAHAEALTLLAAEGEAVVDASDTSEDRFQRRVTEAMEADVDVIALHGADERVPAVSAASIVAKDRRDRHVEAIAERHDRDVGSGYPSDGRTIEFLETYLDREDDLPREVRRSWSTCSDLLGRHRQSSVSDF